LAVIDYARGPVSPVRPHSTAERGRERLVASDKFVLDRLTVDAPRTVGGDDRCHILACVQGAVAVGGDATAGPLATGGTGLMPAAAGQTELRPESPAVVLDICLP
jgi:mannose-6-phosphate isomerase